MERQNLAMRNTVVHLYACPHIKHLDAQRNDIRRKNSTHQLSDFD